MKFLFWLLAILSIPVGLFVSFCSSMIRGLDLAGTGIGEIVCIVGMLALVVSIVCAVLGIIKLRKGNVKKAVVLALIGVAYSVIIIAGMLIDEVAYAILLERDITEREEQMYGEDWNTPPAIEGIPKLYQEVLNKCYVAVRDSWSADQIMDLGLLPMHDYCGAEPLDNIGFALMDLDGDDVDELVLGATAPVDGGTVIFCIYSDPENPFRNINSFEGETYYLHYGETDGAYIAEIIGQDAAWLLEDIEDENIVDITYQEGAMESAGRLTLEMIPFSDYK